ncbi:type II toxin-antitoxin system RelE/ParE family toxin [Pseudomonas sp. IT-P2]
MVVTPNYVIIYTVKVDVVEVLRVLHTRRQWP